MSDVSTLVQHMNQILQDIHATITSLDLKVHDEKLDALEAWRDSAVAELQEVFQKESGDLSQKRRAERDEITEKRRKEDEEIAARRQREDDELHGRDQRKDAERMTKLEGAKKSTEDEADAKMKEVEDEAERMLQERNKKLSELGEKRRDINRRIDEHMNSPLPPLPTRRKRRAESSSQGDQGASTEQHTEPPSQLQQDKTLVEAILPTTEEAASEPDAVPKQEEEPSVAASADVKEVEAGDSRPSEQDPSLPEDSQGKQQAIDNDPKTEEASPRDNASGESVSESKDDLVTPEEDSSIEKEVDSAPENHDPVPDQADVPANEQLPEQDTLHQDDSVHADSSEGSDEGHKSAPPQGDHEASIPAQHGDADDHVTSSIPQDQEAPVSTEQSVVEGTRDVDSGHGEEHQDTPRPEEQAEVPVVQEQQAVPEHEATKTQTDLESEELHVPEEASAQPAGGEKTDEANSSTGIVKGGTAEGYLQMAANPAEMQQEHDTPSSAEHDDSLGDAGASHEGHEPTTPQVVENDAANHESFEQASTQDQSRSLHALETAIDGTSDAQDAVSEDKGVDLSHDVEDISPDTQQSTHQDTDEVMEGREPGGEGALDSQETGPVQQSPDDDIKEGKHSENSVEALTHEQPPSDEGDSQDLSSHPVEETLDHHRVEPIPGTMTHGIDEPADLNTSLEGAANASTSTEKLPDHDHEEEAAVPNEPQVIMRNDSNNNDNETPDDVPNNAEMPSSSDAPKEADSQKDTHTSMVGEETLPAIRTDTATTTAHDEEDEGLFAVPPTPRRELAQEVATENHSAAATPKDIQSECEDVAETSQDTASAVEPPLHDDAKVSPDDNVLLHHPDDPSNDAELDSAEEDPQPAPAPDMQHGRQGPAIMGDPAEESLEGVDHADNTSTPKAEPTEISKEVAEGAQDDQNHEAEVHDSSQFQPSPAIHGQKSPTLDAQVNYDGEGYGPSIPQENEETEVGPSQPANSIQGADDHSTATEPAAIVDVEGENDRHMEEDEPQTAIDSTPSHPADPEQTLERAETPKQFQQESVGNLPDESAHTVQGSDALFDDDDDDDDDDDAEGGDSTYGEVSIEPSERIVYHHADGVENIVDLGGDRSSLNAEHSTVTTLGSQDTRRPMSRGSIGSLASPRETRSTTPVRLSDSSYLGGHSLVRADWAANHENELRSPVRLTPTNSTHDGPVGGGREFAETHGLSDSRWNPEPRSSVAGQQQQQQQTARHPNNEGIDGDSFVPRDVTNTSWHGRNDSVPMSLHSQTTLSSAQSSPIHSSLAADKHEPVIRDSWPGPAPSGYPQYLSSWGGRPRGDSSLSNTSNGEYDPFRSDASPAMNSNPPTHANKGSVYNPFQQRTRAESSVSAAPSQATATSSNNNPSRGGNLFQRMRNVFESNASGNNEPLTVAGRPRPVSGTFSQAYGSHGAADDDRRRTSYEANIANDERSPFLRSSALPSGTRD